MKIDIEELTTRVVDNPHDDTLYLIEKLSHISGLFSLNGNVLYLVENKEDCSSLNILTEYLRLDTNIHVSAFNRKSKSFNSGWYNSVELRIVEKVDCKEELNAFVNLCISHSVYMQGRDFVPFFDSLVSLFQLPKEQHYKNLVGLYGELCLINYFYKSHNVDLSKYWHTAGVNSKLDFVANKFNIEVKSTLSNLLLFHVKHEQLFGTADDTYLAAVSIIEDNSGQSLNEMIEKMLESPDYCNGIGFAINVEAEKRRVSPIEAQQKRFSLKKVNLYNSKEICPFINIPDVVSELSYKIDLTSARCEDCQKIINKLQD